ncbi:MAG TPA: VTT domain-containing protein [Myxococcota bacterium]|nr:VTT domain-containing protein [Myxococcota bacterium]
MIRGPRRIQKLLALAAILAGLGGFAYLYFESGIQWKPESLRDHIAGLGVWGPIAMIGIMTFRPFLGLPSWLVMIATGMLFGPVLGTVCGAVGGTLGGALIFGIARALGRESVQSYLGVGALRSLEEFLALRGAPWLALYTAIPVSWLTPVFAVAGLSRMNFGLFLTATGLGFVPRAALFALAGRAAAQPSVRNIGLAVAFGIAALVCTVFARRWLSAKPSASE